MSDTTVKPVKVMIMDKEFLVACPEEERAALLRSAEYLNARMKDVQRNGKVIGMDRITIMASLNMAHELLKQQESEADLDQSVSKRLFALQEKIDATMNHIQQVGF
jgi:cell division protein ZapA